MGQLKAKGIAGALVGFVVVVASSIVLSLVSPLIFFRLVQSGDLDVLVTSPGPLAYGLAVIFISSAFGVFVCGMVAGKILWINAVLVIALYGGFTYLLSLSPSNQAMPYPGWYVLTSYIVMLPGALAGHYASSGFTRDA